MSKCARFASLSNCLAAILLAVLMGSHPASAQEELKLPYLSPQNTPRPYDDNFCAPYTVWYVLRFAGAKDLSIDAISNEMGCDKDKGASMADIMRALKNHGIVARAVMMTNEGIQQARNPFIVYLQSKKDGKPTSIGHFLLCKPMNDGRVMVFDGRRNPSLMEMAVFAKYQLSETEWDGSCILIGSTYKGAKATSMVIVAAAALGVIGAVTFSFRKSSKKLAGADA